MSAVELIRGALLVGSIILVLVGSIMAFDTVTFDSKGNTLLIFAAIALLIMFNI